MKTRWLFNFSRFIAAGSTDYFTLVDTSRKDAETRDFVQTHYSVAGSISRVDTCDCRDAAFVMVAVGSSQLLVYSAAAGRDELELCASLSVDDRVFGSCFFRYNFCSDPVVCLVGEHGMAVWRFLADKRPEDLHKIEGRPIDPLSQVLMYQYNREYVSVAKKIGDSSYFSVYRVCPASNH